jgi:hypothetical protein
MRSLTLITNRRNNFNNFPYKKFDPCFIVPCFFRECIIFTEFIALNHGNFHLANTEYGIFTEVTDK